MHRFLTASLPVVVAAAAFVLMAPGLRAQQEHDHSAATPAAHACACCGNSSAGAMNHSADGGCCGADTAKATKAGEDHSAHQAAPVAKAEAKPMEHKAGASCCGDMAMMKHDAAPVAKVEPTKPEGASCCAGMAMNHETAAKTEAKAMEHGAAGCCGGAMDMSGCAMMKDHTAASTPKP